MSSWLSLSRAGLFDFLDFCPSDLVRCFCKTHCNQNIQIMACTTQVKYLSNSDEQNWKPSLLIRSQINQTHVAISGHLLVRWCRLIRGIIGSLWDRSHPKNNSNSMEITVHLACVLFLWLFDWYQANRNDYRKEPTFDFRLVRPWEVTGWSISLISVDMSSWLSLSRAGLFDFLDFCPSDLVRCFCKTHCNQNIQIMARTTQVK